MAKRQADDKVLAHPFGPASMKAKGSIIRRVRYTVKAVASELVKTSRGQVDAHRLSLVPADDDETFVAGTPFDIWVADEPFYHVPRGASVLISIDLLPPSDKLAE